MQTMSGTNRNVENVRNNFLPIGAKLRFANHPTTTKDDRSANIEGSIYRPPHGLGNMLRMCYLYCPYPSVISKKQTKQKGHPIGWPLCFIWRLEMTYSRRSRSERMGVNSRCHQYAVWSLD